ncbi:MAG: HAD-IB family hydrolase [Calditrichia bacterium]
MKIAIFDFDGTITDRDTIVPFFLFWIRLTSNIRGLFSLLLFGSFVKLRLMDTQLFKRKIYSILFNGVNRTVLVKASNSFYHRFVKQHLRKEILDLIKKYNADGYRLIVLSANFKFVIEPFCREFGMECWAIDGIAEGDVMTGELEGAFYHGKEKLRIAEARLAEDELENTIAFGDAPSDIYLLKRVKEGIWVGQKS